MTIYFDCAGGAAGDMIIAALLSLGAPRDVLDEGISRLGLNARVTAMPVKRNSIAALLVNVDDGHHAHSQNPHDAHHSYSLADGGEHSHVNRTLGDITAIIDRAKISARAADNAKAVFRRLAEAEAAVHNIPVTEVHFHEVGAVDSIVDIVGTAILLDALSPDAVHASPLPYGFGTIHAAHGVMPNPAPATAELMKGIPSYRVEVEGELVTPTAAALLAHYASSFTNDMNGTIDAVGYGAGTKIYEGSSGVLRVLRLSGATADRSSNAVVIECNIDDMTPEALSYAQTLLMEAGADDAWVTPIVMKKSRAAAMLSVLTEKDHKPFIDIIMRETSTIGLRIVPVTKMKLPREERTIDTEYGPVRVKAVTVNGHTKTKPEHDDCERIARERKIPLAEIHAAVIRALH